MPAPRESRTPVRLARLRRTSAATVVAVAVLGLGACGTSFGAQTNQQYQAGVGADVRDADIQVLGALFVVNEDDSATFSATLVNSSGQVDQLVTVTVTDGEGNDVPTVSTGDLLTLPTGEGLRLGTEGGKVYTALEVTAGLYYTVTLTFETAEEVQIRVPSVLRDSIYDSVVDSSVGADEEDPGDNEAAEEDPSSDDE